MTKSDQPYTVGSQPGVFAVHAWPLFPQSPVPAVYKSAGGLFGGKAAELDSAIQRNPASVAIEAEQFVLSDDLSVEGGVSVSEQQSVDAAMEASYPYTATDACDDISDSAVCSDIESSLIDARVVSFAEATFDEAPLFAFEP